MKGFRSWGLGISKIAAFFCAVFIFLFPIPYSLFPTHADVKIGEKFGFGDITSLGQGTSQLIAPFFSIAAVLVIIYFLLGAFKYLRSGGDKEEVQGARQMITHSMIGFMLLIFTFFIIQYLLSTLFGTSVSLF